MKIQALSGSIAGLELRANIFERHGNNSRLPTGGHLLEEHGLPPHVCSSQEHEDAIRRFMGDDLRLRDFDPSQPPYECARVIQHMFRAVNKRLGKDLRFGEQTPVALGINLEWQYLNMVRANDFEGARFFAEQYAKDFDPREIISERMALAIEPRPLQGTSSWDPATLTNALKNLRRLRWAAEELGFENDWPAWFKPQLVEWLKKDLARSLGVVAPDWNECVPLMLVLEAYDEFLQACVDDAAKAGHDDFPDSCHQLATRLSFGFFNAFGIPVSRGRMLETARRALAAAQQVNATRLADAFRDFGQEGYRTPFSRPDQP